MRWTVKSDDLSCLSAFTDDDCEEIVVAVDAVDAATLTAWADTASFPREKIRLALPLITRAAAGETAKLAEKIRAWLTAGFTRWEVSQLGQLTLLTAGGTSPTTLDLAADWPLYTLNRGAADFLTAQGITRFTASPEDDRNNLRDLLATLSDRLQVIIYQDTPLFTGEACPKSALQSNRSSCSCSGEPVALVNAHGQEYCGFTRHCRTTVTSAEPFCLSAALDELRTMGLQHARVDFVNRRYSPAEAHRLWEQICAGEVLPHTHNGNFMRGLQ